MLKQKILIITILFSIFIPVYGFAFDGTGIWDYSQSYGNTNTCGEPNTPEPAGQVGVLQSGSSFIIFAGDASAQGTVSGNTYTFSDTWCEEYGTVTQTVTLNLSSDTDATGTVGWTYTEPGWGSCTGGHQFNLSKQSQAAPVYDATGKWNFTQSGLVDNCGDFPPPPASGYLEVIQTGNKITATDNLGHQYNGFVNGNQYNVVRSYLPQGGGRTTEWGMVTLTSETQASGMVEFVWDDNCDECWGNWNISLTKEVAVSTYTITAYASDGGTISPFGEVTVVADESQDFQIIPASGYIISDVLVDNSSVGVVSSYTFSNVSADHTIYVIFKRIPFLSFLSLLLE